MMRKLLIILIASVLTMGIGIRALAQTEMYGEVEHQSGESGSTLALGYAWDIDPLMNMAVELKYDAADHGSIVLGGELSRRILYGLTGMVRMELGSYDLFRVKLNSFQNLSGNAQISENVGYSLIFYPGDSGMNSHKLELQVGALKRLTRVMQISCSSTWTSIHYPSGGGNVDSTKWNLNPELKYTVSTALSLSLGYDWAQFSSGGADGTFVLGTNYIINNFTIYVQLPMSTNDHNMIFGASYKY